MYTLCILFSKSMLINLIIRIVFCTLLFLSELEIFGYLLYVFYVSFIYSKISELYTYCILFIGENIVHKVFFNEQNTFCIRNVEIPSFYVFIT